MENKQKICNLKRSNDGVEILSLSDSRNVNKNACKILIIENKIVVFPESDPYALQTS